MDYYSTQILTGHGSFRAKLQTFGLMDNGDCDCILSGADTVEHVLYQCDTYSAYMRPLKERAHMDDVLMSYGPQLSATGPPRDHTK